MVIDLWGGFRDVAAEEPWGEETMILLFSTSKGMAVTAIALSNEVVGIGLYPCTWGVMMIATMYPSSVQ